LPTYTGASAKARGIRVRGNQSDAEHCGEYRDPFVIHFSSGLNLRWAIILPTVGMATITVCNA
jgi:hypothetical protein